MSTPADEQRPSFQFLDAFFQERNIKWMLGIGILTMVGSSLMLVSTHWQQYSPIWKYLTVLGYVAAVHVLGQVTYRSLSLQKTGTGLMALTVFLIPISFSGLHWIGPGVAEISGRTGLLQWGLLGLLAANVAFSFAAAKRIFDHFLRRTQPTFLTTYVLLSLSGAVLPLLPSAAVPWSALVLWGLFTAGTVKVNRHVFWLAEECRWPRIFGFFPILLLGSLFLMQFWVNLTPDVPLSWIGCGLVLTAIPVLLTANVVADVYSQRQPEAGPRLPWSVTLPLFFGLCLTVAGIAVAGVGFPRSFALPPTALLAAFVFAVVAVHGRWKSFVWLMLASILIAYQTCPVFFQETARAVARQGAHAVRETRLPYAFYGLTYLPLLASTTIAAVWLKRRGEQLFALPLRRFSMGLPVLLLAAGWLHAKAQFPVGMVLCGLASVQLLAFRDRRLLPMAIAAFITLAVGFATFWSQVLGAPSGLHLMLISSLSGACLLRWPGEWIDRKTSIRCHSLAWGDRLAFCRLSSLGLTLLLALAWFLQSGRLEPDILICAVVICGLLLRHALDFQQGWIASCAVVVPLSFSAALLLDAGWALPDALLIEVGLMAGIWGIHRRANRPSPADTTATPNPGAGWLVVRRAAANVALAGTIAVTGLYLLPEMLETLVQRWPLHNWAIGILCLCVLIDASRQRRLAALAAFTWMSGQLLIGAAVISFGSREHWDVWLPVVWTMGSVGTLMAQRRPQISRIGWDAPSSAVRGCAFLALFLLSAYSVVDFGVGARLAGLLASAALLWEGHARRQREMKVCGWVLITWQTLSVILQATTPDLSQLWMMNFPLPPAAALPLALAALVLSELWRRAGAVPTLVRLQTRALNVVFVLTIAGSLHFVGQGLTSLEVGIAVLAFSGLAFRALRKAFRELHQENSDNDVSETKLVALYAWLTQYILVMGICYLVLFGVLNIGDTWSLFAPLGCAMAFWLTARGCRRLQNAECIARPFETSAVLLPALTVVFGVVRAVYMVEPHWQGLNSLALLSVSGWYFWRGLEKRQAALLVMAAVALNVATALLWQELAFNDPQFLMIPLGLSILPLVELLKPQLPPAYVDPLRYVGALTILVSPTFEMVSGGWWPMVSLLVVSVVVTLLAMGLRIRPVMFTGTAFLFADLLAMVIRAGMENTNLLWLAGSLVGGAVIVLAAYCERHRERLLQRLRMIASQLETWE